MDILLKLLGEGLATGVTWAEADQAELLTKADAAGVTLEAAAEKLVDAAIEGVSLPSPFNLFPKTVLVQLANNGIASLEAQGVAKAPTLFAMLLALASAQAKKLEAA